jgi:uncharacterized membrane protein YphA (DoxX/SURF4 family)
MATSIPASQPVAIQRIAYVPFGLIVAIVLLRLATGWHFYREGTKKLAYNPETGEVTIAFSAEGMLRQAVGPMKSWIRKELPNFHNWQNELATPWQSRPATPEEEEELEEWQKEYAARQKEAADQDEAPVFEFAPNLSYGKWATRVVEDWRATVEGVKAIEQLSDEQREAAEAALAARRTQLSDYLSSQGSAIVEWQHELWRLEQWKAAAGAQGIPFEQDRIAEKEAETTAASAAWIAQVRNIERGLNADLRRILNAEQLEDPEVVGQYDSLLADTKDVQLHRLNVAVTCLIIGVGVCLMLGLFTRLASLGGVAFLVSVIATQPPWVVGADSTVFYYQLVEIAGLLVLFASAAGRWAGLDFIIRALLGKCCGRKESF